MNAIATIFLYALGLVMMLSLHRIAWGPTVFDRLTGLGLIGTKTVVVLVLLGMATDSIPLFVDIALAYSAIAYVGTLTLAKYFEKGGSIDP